MQDNQEIFFYRSNNVWYKN